MFRFLAYPKVYNLESAYYQMNSLNTTIENLNLQRMLGLIRFKKSGLQRTSDGNHSANPKLKRAFEGNQSENTKLKRAFEGNQSENTKLKRAFV
jgi:hypothetical protein